MYFTPKYPRKAFIPLFVFAVVAAPAMWPQANPAQSSASNRPSFDVVSIKLHGGGASAGINLARSGGHVSLTAGLRALMILAYDLHNLSQASDVIVGMPSWAGSETFDIQAEAPGNPTVEQKRLMLQSLLADHFKMVVHHETRESPIYALILANGEKLGPQLRPHAADTDCNASPNASRPANDDSSAAIALQDLQRFPCGRVAGGFLSPGDHIQVWSGGRNVSMDTIANGIGGMEYIDHPVVNRTGLAGNFDFTVEWDSRTATEDFSAGPARGAQSEPVGDSLLEAMRDQLGLKLDLEKGPVDFIVIDHVERPAPN